MVLQRRFLARTGSWWVALAILAICTCTIAGGQKLALCISADGHLDLKHVADGCHGCPVSNCQRDLPPLPQPTGTPPTLPDTCCRDIPVVFDLVGWLAPRGPDDGQDQREAPTPVTLVSAGDAGLVGQLRGDPNPQLAASRPADHLAALASVFLLL